MAVLTLDEQRKIDDVVNDVLLQTGLSYPANSLLDIIKGYDPKLEVKEFDFKDDTSTVKGAIIYTNSQPAILINENKTSDTGKTFTLAHEFGHYLLHKNHTKFRLDLFDYSQDTLESRQETEANYFAGCLLMPEKELRELVKLTTDNFKIASYFGVSERAVEVRLKWLKMNQK